MPTKQLHDFAFRWFEKYRSPYVTEQELKEGFAEECFALGFEMDCGNSFAEKHPDTQDYRNLDKIIEDVIDIGLLGSAIFSKWRYITHWSYNGSLLSDNNRKWFIIAFGRLVALTSKSKISPLIFEGTAREVRIISKSTCYGRCPDPDNEVEQHLTIMMDGRASFSSCYWDDGTKYIEDQIKNFQIKSETAVYLLEKISNYFSNEYDIAFVTDVGSWSVKMVNTVGEEYVFDGLLSPDLNELDKISSAIRYHLDIPELLVFNGKAIANRIERFVIDYRRVTKIETKVPFSPEIEYTSWDYTEQICIDRKSQTLEHIQNFGSGCVVSRKYYVEDGISSLLDSLNEDTFITRVIGNTPDTIDNPLETQEYQMSVEFLYGKPRVINGTFDKNGLPEDFPKFAEKTYNFMCFYGMGEVLNPSVYEKSKRKTSDYILCSVEFNEGSKSYYYLTEDDSLEIGDIVLVPVGKDGRTAIVEIVDIEHFSEENAPFPLDKVKRIIGKHTWDSEQEHSGA